jgi:hypothetical protein
MELITAKEYAQRIKHKSSEVVRYIRECRIKAVELQKIGYNKRKVRMYRLEDLQRIRFKRPKLLACGS